MISFFFWVAAGGRGIFEGGDKVLEGVLKGAGKQTWTIKTIAERDKQTNKQTKTGRLRYIEDHRRVGLHSGFIKTFLHCGRCS